MENHRNTTIGTHRSHRALPMLDASYVALDDDSPADMLREAIALAEELRFVPGQLANAQDWNAMLANATGDWSAFLGDAKGPVAIEFQRFLSDPVNYVPGEGAPLSRPHVALYVAFLYVLRHARAELNGFTQRHLEHYLQQVLLLAPLPAEPAESFVTLTLDENERATRIPAGSRLIAPEPNPDLVVVSTADLELHHGSLAQVAAIRVSFADSGFRKLFETSEPNPDLKALHMQQAMEAIRQHIWIHGVQQELQARVPGTTWVSFEATYDELQVKDNRKSFPDELLGITMDEFVRMMRLQPKGLPLTDAEDELMRKWEGLHARMLIAKHIPMPSLPNMGSHKDLSEKLSAGLFNGAPLPNYRNAPVDLKQIYQDLRYPEKSQDSIAAVNYVRHRLKMSESTFQQLYEMGGTSDGLPRQPQAIMEAAIKKASSLSPMLQRKRTMRLGSAADATRLSRQASGLQGGWFPYGLLDQNTSTTAEFSEFGLIVESPLLELSEGDRVITVTLFLAHANMAEVAALFDLSATAPGDWVSPFTFQVSGEKGWIDANWRATRPVVDANASKVVITLTIPANVPSVTRPGDKFPQENLRGKGALLNLRLSPAVSAGIGQVDGAKHFFLQCLLLKQINLQVAVTGLRNVQAENHQSSLKVSAPFQPFGSQPGPFAEFMVAHPEICMKQLDSLQFSLDWMEMPADVGAYYDPYFRAMGPYPAVTNIPHAKTDFKASVEMITGRWAKPMAQENVSFLAANLNLPITGMEALEEEYTPAQMASWNTPSDWPRYFKFVYRNEWYPHKEQENASRRLNRAVMRASDTLATAMDALAKNVTTANQQAVTTAKAELQALLDLDIPEPYVPKLKGLSLGYTAKVDIPLAIWDMDTPRKERLYHQLPFGFRPMAIGAGSPLPLLPGFSAQGSVILGFEKVQPGSVLSMLLKVQPGSGNPDVPAPAVSWSYYSNAGWRILPPNSILEDETLGLTQTGLLKFMLPSDAAPSDGELPAGKYWLMAGTEGNCEHLPDWTNLHLHAIRVRQEVNGNPNMPWKLPAGSITAFESNMPMVKTVVQPYPSTGGKPPESKDEFHKRVSERLRHKNRAITAWDYEHLCLQKFPDLFAVRALQAKASEGQMPGSMSVVVVPDLRSRPFADPFLPKLGYGELHEISDFVQNLAPPSAIVRARNPTYRPVVVGTSIHFAEGMSAATGKYLVQERLKQFLAPWAYDSAKSMSFGGRLYVSEIVDLIQGEPYVHFVGKTRLFVGDENGEYKEAIVHDGDSSAYIEVAESDVLTTSPTHLISEIADEDVQDEIWQGIGWMVIGTDFIIADDPETDEDVYEEWVGISWAVIGKDFIIGES